MKFRTEIEQFKGSFAITHSDRIVMIGSCFADNIGEMLARDGFNVIHNPMGPLFNPESIGRILRRGAKAYTRDDFVEHGGRWHCLDFASRYQDDDPARLAETVNSDYLPFAEAIDRADVMIVTFGTSKVYRHDDVTVGNCHKLPGTMFRENHLSVEDIENALPSGLESKTILTLSPVRYPGEGLAKGFLAKAALRVAIDRICGKRGYDYFPAFEIVNDDLRDYRFYSSDMRHPSETAVEYIYEKFADAYFSEETKNEAMGQRKISLRAAHRPIITDK